MIDYDYINTLGEPLYEKEIDELGLCKFIVDGIDSRVPHFIILAEDIDEAYSISLLEVLYYSHDGVNSHFETYKQKEAMFSFLNEPYEWPHSEKRLVTTKWRGLLDRWVEINVGSYYEMSTLLDRVPQPDYRTLIFERPSEDDEYPLTEYWDIINGTDAITTDLKYALNGGNAISTMAQIIAIIDGGDSVRYDHGSIEGVELYYNDETEEEIDEEPEDEEDDATKLTNLLEHGAGIKYIEGITTPTEYVTLEDGGDENYHVVASMYTDYKTYTTSNAIMKTFTVTNPVTYSTIGSLYTRTGTSKGICFKTIKTSSTNTYTTTTYKSTEYSRTLTTISASTTCTSTNTLLRTVSSSSNEIKRTKYEIDNSIPEYETYTNRSMYVTSGTHTDRNEISVYTSSYAGLSASSTRYYNKRTTITDTLTNTYKTTTQIDASVVESIGTSSKISTYRTLTKYVSSYKYMYIPVVSTSTTFNRTVTYLGGISESNETGIFTYPTAHPYTSSQTCHATRTKIETVSNTTYYTITDATSSTEYESVYTGTRTVEFHTTSPTTYKISNTFSRTRSSQIVLSTLTTGTSRQPCTSFKTSSSSGVTARNWYSSVNSKGSTVHYTLTTSETKLTYSSIRYSTSYTSYYKTITAKTLINDDTTSTYRTRTATTSSGTYYNFYSLSKSSTVDVTTPVNSTGSVYYETNMSTIAIEFTTTSRYTGSMYETSSITTSSSYATFDYIISNLTNTRTSVYDNIATVTYGNNDTTTVRYTTSSIYYD